MKVSREISRIKQAKICIFRGRALYFIYITYIFYKKPVLKHGLCSFRILLLQRLSTICVSLCIVCCIVYCASMCILTIKKRKKYNHCCWQSRHTAGLVHWVRPDSSQKLYPSEDQLSLQLSMNI